MTIEQCFNFLNALSVAHESVHSVMIGLSWKIVIFSVLLRIIAAGVLAVDRRDLSSTSKAWKYVSALHMHYPFR